MCTYKYVREIAYSIYTKRENSHKYMKYLSTEMDEGYIDYC